MSHNEREAQNNAMAQSQSYPLRTSNKVPANHDLYIGLIPGDVDINMLHSYFSHFGEIERIYEGRGRQTVTGMKWAFISYIHAEDAYKYIIAVTFLMNSVLQQAGRIALAGSVLYFIQHSSI